MRVMLTHANWNDELCVPLFASLPRYQCEKPLFAADDNVYAANKRARSISILVDHARVILQCIPRCIHRLLSEKNDGSVIREAQRSFVSSRLSFPRGM